MVVLIGDVTVEAADVLAAQLAKLRQASDVIVDLHDVTAFAPPAVGALVNARAQVAADGWGFAVVADPDGACMEAIRRAGQVKTLRPVATRKEARAQLQSA